VKGYEELINGNPAKYKPVFKLDAENQPVVLRNNRLFLSAVYKSKVKAVYKSKVKAV